MNGPTHSPRRALETFALEGEASGPGQRWRYTVAVDEALTELELGLCIDGPRPKRLAAEPGSMPFLRSARVRGGPELARERGGLVVETLGEAGCVDLVIDLEGLTNSSARDKLRRGNGVMAAPRSWLWHPAKVPAGVDATVEFELPEGIHAAAPWPAIDPAEGPEGARVLSGSAFRWDAWVAFTRSEPLRFRAADCAFEVAVLGDSRDGLAGDFATLDESDLQDWITVAAETSATLYGRFPRDHVAVVALPWSAWGDSPVYFGMARRGGGASAMLMVNVEAEAERLVGEWVAVHEFLHFGMPLIGDPWMSEGFVTYYTEILRARLGVMGSPEHWDQPEEQARRALKNIASGFRSARRSSRTLLESSDNMRRYGGYNRVYWGGAAVAYDLDMQLREASGGRHSLDELMRAQVRLVPEERHTRASALFEGFEGQVQGWHAAGELDREISPLEIMAAHERARSIPARLRELEGLAVRVDGKEVHLDSSPLVEVTTRDNLFANGGFVRTRPKENLGPQLTQKSE
ncbi:hypothetical protein PPSIR1_00135 [Plesiocystis pacifica SIR-1]|uniref:Peptidase M61 catalytic domain-containing protein n=1 Tax=Plesiocystis pacifica SIR-1 TaxID=391625 RepID=A6GEU2_9BACT|nr:hypothetical protein [Plesiocystis pacifica]EDM75604.1 hypothetical protein PPSIR1_00135 [Plesiocystis pacifica SIR-1]